MTEATESTESAEATETTAAAVTEAAQAPTEGDKEPNGHANESAAGEAGGDAVAGPEDALPSWRDGIPDDLRKSAEQFTSPTALLKSYGELRKQFNKAIQPLPEKPNDEQLAAFRKKQGIPETPEAYGIEAPEWFDDRGKENLTDFLGKAHGLNLTPDQVKGVVEAYAGYTQAGAEASIAEINAHTEASMKALKDEWGTDYDANVDLAHRAILHFAGQDVLQELQEAKLEGGGVAASLPGVAKAFASIGRAASEMVGVLPSMTGESSKDDLVKERRELMESDDYWTNSTKQARSREISELLVGKAPHSGPGVMR